MLSGIHGRACGVKFPEMVEKALREPFELWAHDDKLWVTAPGLKFVHPRSTSLNDLEPFEVLIPISVGSTVEWPGAVASPKPSKNGPCEFPRSPLVHFLSPVLPEPGIHVSGVPGTPKDAFAALIFFLTVSRKVGVRFLSSK